MMCNRNDNDKHMYNSLTMKGLPAWLSHVTALYRGQERRLEALPSQQVTSLGWTSGSRPCAASSADLKQGPFRKGRGSPGRVVLDFLELSMFPSEQLALEHLQLWDAMGLETHTPACHPLPEGPGAGCFLCRQPL